MGSLKIAPIIAASLTCANCFQHSYAQLSISDSQTSDSMQTTAGTRTTGIVTSGGPSQTGSASEGTGLSVTADGGTSMQVGETVETTTELTTQDGSTSTPDNGTAATSTGTTTSEEVECTEASLPLLLGGKCYHPNEIRRVFVTSDVFDGAMENPDHRCKKAAGAADLESPDDYKAWAMVNGESPSGRFDTTFSGPYVKLQNGQFSLVALGWSGLTTMSLLSAINVTEYGSMVNGFAWTAVKEDGSKSLGSDCESWSNNNPKENGWFCEAKHDYGTVGVVGETEISWSDAEEMKCVWPFPCCWGLYSFQAEISECDSKHRLYCFQDKEK